MHALFLLLNFAHAGKPALCGRDWSHDIPVSSSGTFINREQYFARAVRPGMARLQADLCRCLPRLERKWPARVHADLAVEPNKGRMRVHYDLEDDGRARIGRMRSCMGHPVMTFEPIPYVSDVILESGERGSFPLLPVVINLKEPNRGGPREVSR